MSLSVPTERRHARILIVDDRVDNLVALEAVLEPLGFDLVKASSGTEALHRLLEQEITMIVLDVQMPGMDGFETATLLKSRLATRHIPIVFLTAVSHDFEYQMRGYDLGAVDYISKPFDPDVLRAKVVSLVELSGELQELARANALYRQGAEVVAAHIDAEEHAGGDRALANFVDLARVLDLRLDARLDAPGIARAAVRKELGDLPEDLVDSVTLLISELVGNAVVHARSTATISIDLGSTTLRAEVADAGLRGPSTRRPDLDDDDGRGLHIVRRMADRCGWTRLADGKTVWFEIDFEGRQSA
jgi:CheY-like chemotaxis protein